MYLLIGHPQDPCCQTVSAELELRGLQASIIANPMVHPWRVSSRFGDAKARGQFGTEQERDLELEGVLVRGRGEVESAEWQSKDLLYMQSEMQAALLGWLWTLPCPVINRPPAWLWYRPQASLAFWQPLLWRCGLRTAEMMVSNIESEACAFGQRHAGITVYAPLTVGERYLIAGDEDWNGLAALERVAPVALRQSLDGAHLACVVGKQVVWDGKPPADTLAIEPRLTSFAAAMKLDFLQIVLAPSGGDWRVVAVEPQPCFEQFGAVARQTMAGHLVQLLTTANASQRKAAVVCGAV